MIGAGLEGRGRGELLWFEEAWYWIEGEDLLVCTLLLRVQDAETRD